MSKVRQNWYVYFRDGAFTFARYDVFHAAASATKDLSRAFTPWSHVVALIYQQLTKTESLNGVCDAAGEDVNANKQTNPVTTELKVK